MSDPRSPSSWKESRRRAAVEIGEGSAVGAMSFVPKGTKIPPNQAWGGVPARPIKQYEEGEFEKKGQPGIPVAY